MTLASLAGTAIVPIGCGLMLPQNTGPDSSTVGTVDAVNEAVIMVGYVVTSDGGSHVINTTGSSSLGWRTSTVTFANAATTVTVGLAAVDTAAGPPARAVNVANVITFDVSRSMIGGGGGITANAWQTHVPDTGTKTIANGDLVAFCVQMTARGGVDSVVGAFSNVAHQMPSMTLYTATYASIGLPNCIITFSDGAIGHFYGSEVFSTQSQRTWSSASGTKEYGQLFNLPFPCRINGVYGWCTMDGDVNIVLYSVPLSATPVAEKTVLFDANTTGSVFGRSFYVLFPAPYAYTANTDIAAVLKPGATSVTAFYKTLANANHRVAEPFGTGGYGVSRATAAFANANSSLDHYYVGLLVGAFDAGGAAGRVVQINNDSLVA